MFCLISIYFFKKILLIFTISNHIPSYCSYPVTAYALCSMEAEVLFTLQSITSFSLFPHSQPLRICHASYTLLIRVTAAQLPPRRGRLRTNSFVGSQLSRLHVLPDGQCSASPPFPPDTCLFPSFTSSFLYPTAMYPFSTDFPVCVTLVKYLKQTRSYITW